MIHIYPFYFNYLCPVLIFLYCLFYPFITYNLYFSQIIYVHSVKTVLRLQSRPHPPQIIAQGLNWAIYGPTESQYIGPWLPYHGLETSALGLWLLSRPIMNIGLDSWSPTHPFSQSIWIVGSYSRNLSTWWPW